MKAISFMSFIIYFGMIFALGVGAYPLVKNSFTTDNPVIKERLTTDHFRDTTKKVISAVIGAITVVESDVNSDAVNGDAVGAFQIRPIFVQDINRILGEERYTLADRWDYGKSREMVRIYFDHYLKYWTLEKCIKFYNAGHKWESPAPQRYYDRVMEIVK